VVKREIVVWVVLGEMIQIPKIPSRNGYACGGQCCG
jgi:hypothetical protein